MNSTQTVYQSKVDSSVNFVESQLIGFIESRYVRRQQEYFTAYLSSQTGCNRGCRMCHLTATDQTQFKNADFGDFVSQFKTILNHYRQHPPAQFVHLAWMARGEPLANPTVTETSTELLSALGAEAIQAGVKPKFNISTIMPVTFKKTLVDAFPVITPTIYYSLYSMDSNFRKKWLPAAMDPNQALDLLAEYQWFSKKIVKIHGAFIEGENDSVDHVRQMCDAVIRRGIKAEFNIVRYNPYSPNQGQESPNLDAIYSVIAEHMPCKLISRVGVDCKASCGQFVQ
jgi:23S rRNA (adenine2503-C2)-methyltransferase